MSQQEQLLQWVNQDLHLSKNISNINQDFGNGFLFKEVLNKLGYNFQDLNKIINKKEGQMTQQNFFVIKEVCAKNFGLDLKSKSAQNRPQEFLTQIYQHILQNQKTNKKFGNSKKNLPTLLNKNQNQKSINNHKQNFSQEINSQNKNNNVFEQFTSTINKNNDRHLQSSFKSNTFTKTHLPRKILEIEEKLEKFREEKIKHEIIAKQQFEQDQILDWELKQEFRQQELEKLRANKTYMKDVEQRIYQNWQKTEMDKKARQDKEKQFQDFMTGKILKKIQDQRDLEEDEFVNGVKYFKKNAQRQGIELKHNPEEEKREVKKPKFNPQTTLAKIKERTQQQIEARKLKQKRQNKMMVDQLIQTEIVEQKKQQADFLEKVFKNSIQCNQEGWKQVDTINKEQIISDNRLLASEKFNTDLNEYFRQQQLEQKQNQEEKQRIREKEIRQRDLEYMQINLDRKINKRKKHNKICENTLDQILDLVDICFKHQQKNNSQQLDQSYWDDMLKKFINNKLYDNQQSVDLFQQEKNQLTSNLNLDESDQAQKKQAEDEFKQYFSAQKIWNAVHEFPEGKQKFNFIDNNDYLGNFLTEIVDNLHPKQEKTQIPQEIPNYLPLKLSMIGLPFSGKKTLANLLKQKYQLELIDPKQIIQQAHELAFPPPEDDKNKKKGAKKDTKKKANAKDQEEEKPVNPDLIELGQKVHEFIENNLEIPDELQVQAAVIQIKELFPLLTNEELVQKIQNWNEAEEQRQANILKEQEEMLKKNAKKPAKAPAKKGAKEQPVTEEKPEEKSEQELLEEKIKEKKPFGYSQGYVLLNFPLNLKQAKLLEKQLIGFVTEDERLNPKAEEKKKVIGQLVKQKETPPDTTLKQSGIDLYIYLDNNQEEVVKRADGRRIDPTTETVYHLDYNPPTDPKIKDRLQELPAESENIKKFEEQLEKEKEPLFNYLQIFGQEGAYQAFSKINTQESLLQSYLNLENLIQKVLLQKRPDLEEKVESQLKLEQHQQQQLKEEQQKQEEIQNQENQEKEKQEINQENGEEMQQENKNSEKNNQEVSQKSDQSIQEQQQQEEENEKDIKSPLDILNQQQMEELIKIWDDVQIQYVKDLQSAFINIDDHRQSVDQKSEDLQNRFLQIVEKQDDKQEKIDQYVQSYNRFYQESGQIMKFQNAKNEIQIHLDEVYESLWDSIENKKNLAQLERKNITCSGWIESEMEKVFGQFFRIYQIEINKLHEIVEMFYFILDTLENKPINEVQEHVVLEPDFQQAPIEDYKNSTYPKIDILYQHYLDIVYSIDDKIRDMRKKFLKRRYGKQAEKLQDLSQTKRYQFIYGIYNQILDQEKKNLAVRGLIIKNTLISRIQQLRILGQSLYNKMDDWIIFGLKSENDAIYQVVKQLKECISQQKPASIEKIYIQNISEIHKPIRILKQVFRKLHPLEKNQNKRFTTQQLKLIIHEIKSIQDNSQKISGFTFYQLFQRRKNFPDCQNYIPDCIQQLSDDKIKLLIFRMGAIQRGETLQNFQNTDFLNSQKEFSSKFASLQKSQADILMETLNNENQSFSPKILLTALVLLDSSLPTSTDIEEYQNLFANFCQSCSAKDTLIYHEDFIQIPAWFDQSEDDNNNYEGYQINRTKFIKSLLFDVYRQPQENYIDYRVYIKQLKKFSDIEFGSYWNLLFGEI